MSKMSNRSSRQEVAKETISIIAKKAYDFEGNSVNLYGDLDYSSKLYVEEELDVLCKNSELNKRNFKTKLKFKKESVVSTIITCGKSPKEYGKVTVLTFASARHAGGGFLKGSMAQEEAIAYASDLHPRIKNFPDFYKYSKHFKSGIYSHRMIYTKNLVVFRDANGDLLKAPVNCDVISSCAVNITDLKRKNQYDLISIANEVMTERIERVIALAKDNHTDTLILGAFGTGVFGNNPYRIKEAFQTILNKPEYRTAFKFVIFAVTDSLRGSTDVYSIFSDIKLSKISEWN